MSQKVNKSRLNNNQQYETLLINLQANILKGHGRDFAHHLFFKFDQSKIEAAQNWIRGFAKATITSAKKQLDDTKAFHDGIITDGGTIVTLSLTSPGYDALGASKIKPVSSAFNQGMEGRAELLGDDKSNWEEPFKSLIHMLIIVADDQSVTAKSKANKIINEISSFASLLLNQRGNILRKCGIGIEHFGYADGISQPLYLAEDIGKQTSTIEWDDATDISLLLVQDTATQQPESFGSFLVFRKLEQNVKAFKDNEGDNPPALGTLPLIKDVSGNDNKELAGAMIVGRFENSVPVIKSSIDSIANPPIITNDFNYADDFIATKCPFHAHTRLMNPRKGDEVAGDVSAQRITRRGIPYDDVNRIPEEQITKISDELLDENQPENGVGLLFMCYQSSIETQFEIIQGHWANQGQIKTHAIGSQDSIIGQGSNPDKTLPIQWGQPNQSKAFAFSSFVKMRGGVSSTFGDFVIFVSFSFSSLIFLQIDTYGVIGSSFVIKFIPPPGAFLSLRAYYDSKCIIL